MRYGLRTGERALGVVGDWEPMVMSEMQMVMRVPEWERFGWLRHGFSTRAGGVSEVYGPAELNLGFTDADETVRVRENRRRFAEAVSGDARPMVVVRQVHGSEVRVAGADAARTMLREDGRAAWEADGLVTANAGVLLGIQVADCVPVLVADTRLRVVGAFHAGWRGTVAGMVGTGVLRMREEFGTLPADVVAAVGPSIRACCYSVGDEVRERFGAGFGYASELFSERDDALYLDLAEANRRQLMDAGVPASGITVLAECTGCGRLADGRRKYFSHRMEKGFAGRGMGAIGVRESATGPHEY